MLKPSPIMTDIADAIREKDGTSALIPVPNFGNRIRALPIPPASGWANNRRTYRFEHFLTNEEQDELELVRCDGRPAYETFTEIFNTFKPPPPNDWIRLAGELQVPNRQYAWTLGAVSSHDTTTSATLLVGTKLYVGSNTAATSILIINTVTGRTSAVEGLPSRVYNRFELINNKIYCLHIQSNLTAVNSIVCINTVDDTFILIGLSETLGYGSFRLVGHRLFIGIRNNSKTYLPFIDINFDVAGYVHGLPGSPNWIAPGELIAAGTKLYVAMAAGASSSARFIVIDTTKIGTGENPVTVVTGFTARYFNVQLLVGNYLYIADGLSAKTSILRIDTTNDSWIEIGPLPNRIYSVFQLLGNKIYVGSTTSANSMIRINNNVAGSFFEIPDMPNRTYTAFQLVGTKLYVGSTSYVNTLVVIDTGFDSFEEITLPVSNDYGRFFMNGQMMYLFGINGSVTSIVMVNTANDAVTQITGLTSRIHLPSVIAHDRLYLGSTSTSTFIPVIDLTANTLIEQIQDLPNRGHNVMVFVNEKIYVLSSTASAFLTVLSRSVLPNHPFPIYMKYGS